MRRRAERRRATRESAIEPTVGASPDELLAQLRLHRLLTDLVLELEEPFRATILARFVEGRSAVDIARGAGIPDSTVRWRLREGLGRLRAQLDVRDEGRKGWAPGVLAFAKGGINVAKPAKSLTTIILLLLALLGGIAIVGIILAHHRSDDPPRNGAPGVTPSPPSDPRAALHRRFPASPRPVLPAMLPPGTFALGPSATIASASSTSTTPPAPPKLVEFDFRAAPFVALMHIFGNQLETPIWVAYETDAKIDVTTHGQRPAIDVFDEVLDSAGANRAEVAAIRIVPAGRTDAAALGGEPVTLSFRNTPLNFVLDALEPRLGMPIARLGPEAIPGTMDMDGNPIVEESPSITLELHDVAAGAALEQALIQAGVGYELTTGFVILPR